MKKENNEELVEEEAVEQKPKKRKHIKTIRGRALTAYIVVIIVIALALAYGCGFLLGKEMYDKKENKDEPAPTEEPKKEEPKEEPKENENVEKQVTADGTIKALKDKYDMLFGDYISILGNNDDESLTGRVLDHITFTETETDYSKTGYYFKGAKPATEVAKIYNDLFGKTFDKTANYSGICTEYKYDSKNDTIVQTKLGCDAGWGNFNEDYIYKYTEDNDYYYVYAAVANYNGIEKIDIISDKENNYIYKTVNDTDDFTLDETNYAYFAKYRVKFKKVSGNYYYYGIEKVENGKKQ